MVLKGFLVFGLFFLSSLVGFGGCGDDFLCCVGRPDYYVSNATCVTVGGQQIPYECEYTPCPEGGGGGGTGGEGTPNCDPMQWWVCDPFAL
jgi:hypothetical protein